MAEEITLRVALPEVVEAPIDIMAQASQSDRIERDEQVIQHVAQPNTPSTRARAQSATR
jgi:hypothetical protein